MTNKLDNNSRSKRHKAALSFYNHSDGYNQYYIDRINFFTKNNIKTCDYDDILIKLSASGMDLYNVETPDRNKKMYEIALYQTDRVIRLIPKQLLLETFIKLTSGVRKVTRPRPKDKGLVDAVLEEIEYRGIVDISNTIEKKIVVRKNKNIEYQLMDYYEYYKDKKSFNMYDNNNISSLIYHGLSYKEALIILSYNGLLLGKVPIECRSRRMCYVSILQNRSAVKYIPNKYLKGDG